MENEMSERLMVDADGDLMWLMFAEQYMVVTGVQNIGRNILLTNTNNYRYIYFTSSQPPIV